MSAFLQNLMIVSPGLLALGIVLFSRLADRPSRKIEVAEWTPEQKADLFDALDEFFSSERGQALIRQAVDSSRFEVKQADWMRSREGRAVLREMLATMPNPLRRASGSA